MQTGPNYHGFEHPAWSACIMTSWRKQKTRLRVAGGRESLRHWHSMDGMVSQLGRGRSKCFWKEVWTNGITC